MNNTAVKTTPVNMEERQNLEIKAGDTVRVWQKIEEKGKTRLQAFEGIVLARKHGDEAGGTFTVRRVTGGFGVEKIFPLYSPMIDKIEVLKRAKTRRAKLYYIRDKVAREIRRQMRRSVAVDLSTESAMEVEARKEAEAKAAEEAAAKAAEEAKKKEEEAKAAAEAAQAEAPAEDKTEEAEAPTEGESEEEKKEA